MSRKVKNIIIILLIIIVGIASGFTIMLAKNSVKENSNGVMQTPSQDQSGMQEQGAGPGQMQGQQSNSEMSQSQGTPPEMPNSNMKEESSNSDNQGTPPAKPDGSEENGDMTEPPEKPDSSSENSDQDSAQEDNKMTTMQGSSEQSNNQMQPPSMPGQNANNESSELDIAYYILFGIEGFAISALLAYLIMSNFNKHTMTIALGGAKRIIIFVILVVLLTSVLTVVQSFIVNKLIEDNQTQNQGGMQMPGGNGGMSGNVTYTASKEITEDSTIESGEYSSTTTDENALLVSGDVDVSVSNATITKTGDSEGGDNSNFYGNNSAVLAKDGANLTLKNITVTTDADGANGVFSYGGSATTNNSSSDGTTITISDSTITTTGDNAGGIMTTGGGTTNANNLTINTSGTSSAAIRSDRGGGTVNVDKGTYTTTGQGSPAVYSTANIKVSNADLIAKASEGIVIEGANTVSIENCNLIDSNTKLNGQSTTYKNIFLYQSMSGDASNGTATFTAKNSKITTNNGDTLYVTNTTATINLENNTIINNDSTGNFLRAQKDSWGNSGSNGGNVTLKMTNQKAEGNIVIDSISTLNMQMMEGSYYEGTINRANEAKSIELKLDSTSKIKLTGDSYITSLEDADTTYSNIDFNGYKLYVNGVAIN